MSEIVSSIEGRLSKWGKRALVGGVAVCATASPVIGPGAPVAFADSGDRPWWQTLTCEEQRAENPKIKCPSGSSSSSSRVESSDRPWWQTLTCEEQRAKNSDIVCAGSASPRPKSNVPRSGVPSIKPYESKRGFWEIFTRDEEAYMITDSEPWFQDTRTGRYTIEPWIVTDGVRWGYNPKTGKHDSEETIMTDGEPWDYDPATGTYYERK